MRLSKFTVIRIQKKILKWKIFKMVNNFKIRKLVEVVKRKMIQAEGGGNIFELFYMHPLRYKLKIKVVSLFYN